MKLRAAVFDFGETLLSEERAWGVWADWIGVTPPGALRGARRDRRGPPPARARPGAVPPRVRSAARARGAARGGRAAPRGALRRVPGRRGRAGAAACGGPASRDRRQPAFGGGGVRSRTSSLRATSWRPRPTGAWPSPTRRTSRACWRSWTAGGSGRARRDRVDYDILPAAAAGLFTVHLRRGPWGIIQAAWPDAAVASAQRRRSRTKRSTRSWPRSRHDESIDVVAVNPGCPSDHSMRAC